MSRLHLTSSGVALAWCLVLGGCGSDSAGVETLPGVEITVTPTDLVLPIGGQGRLTATVTDLEGRPLPGREVRWSSSAPDIADVSSSGVVTAFDVGTASIGAYSDQGVGFARVSVRLGFRLPLQGRGWLVLTEIGTPTSGCPGGEGGLRMDGSRDCRHSGASRYSLDLADKEQWTGSSDPAPSEVVAAASGTITDICIQSPTEVTCGANGPFVQVDHPGGYRTIYAHLDPSSVTLRRKTPISMGQPIGVMGRWGPDPAPWLHFEVRYENEGAREARILDGLMLGGKPIREYRAGEAPQP